MKGKNKMRIEALCSISSVCKVRGKVDEVLKGTNTEEKRYKQL